MGGALCKVNKIMIKHKPLPVALTCWHHLLCSGLGQEEHPPSPVWCWSAFLCWSEEEAVMPRFDWIESWFTCSVWSKSCCWFTCRPWVLWIGSPRSDALWVSAPWRRWPFLSRTAWKTRTDHACPVWTPLVSLQLIHNTDPREALLRY